MKGFRKKSQLLIIALVVGFLIGIIYENVAVKGTGGSLEIFRSYFFERLEEVSIIPEKFIWHVIQTRIVSILIIVLIGCLKWKKTGAIVWCGWTGFLLGALVVSAIIQMGLKGLLMIVVGMFPHMLFYIPSYVILFMYIYEYPKIQWNWSKTIFVFLIVVMGIILESYMNPIIVKFVAKIV